MFRSNKKSLVNKTVRKSHARKGAPARSAAFGPGMELLEQRQLMSVATASLTDDIFTNATSLGSFRLHSQKAIHGAVGSTTAQDIYQVNVTSPVTLNIALTSVQQQDSMTLMFPDGTEIDTLSTTRATARVSQLLDAGTYFIEVSHGYTATAAAAQKILPATYGNFAMTMTATKATTSTAPQNQADFGAFDAATGGAQEPLANAVATPAGTTYADFSSDPLFGPDGPSPDDVQQQTCGDCYFLAALSSIARVDPGLIEQDVQSTGSDEYKVKFERNGQDVWISVDGELPQVNGQLVYANVGTDNDIWVPIMEKAFCYFRDPQNVSYASIEGGGSDEAFEDLGGTVTTISRTQMKNGAGLTNEINSLINAGDVVTLGTQAEDTTTLVADHVYSVVGPSSGGIVNLRNPWGTDPVNAADPQGPDVDDNGYLNASNTAAFADTSVLWGAVLPKVNPVNNPVTSGSTATLTGTVYNDLNKDGTLDSGDPGIAGVTIYLTTTSGAAYSAGDVTAVTDSNGVYTFNGLNAGTTYYAYEVQPQGYTDTDNANGYNVTPVAGTTYTANFGNTQNVTTTGTSTVSGVVYDDLNNDQTLDQGDPGISGVTVYATTTSGAAFSSSDLYAVTNSNGNYTLDGIQPGTTYYIYEIAPAGYTISAHAAGWNTNLTAGNNAINVDFGDVQTSNPASVTGTVFNDLNDDQTLDSGDPGISGVTVYATTTDHGTFASSDPWALSESNGQFTLYGLTPGVKYYVYEVTPTGWTNSKGNGAGYYTTLSSGEDQSGFYFANVQSTPSAILNVSSTMFSDLSVINGSLGPQSSTLRDGTVVDAFVTTALTSGETYLSVGGQNSNFNAEIEVVDFSPSGAVLDTVTGSASGSGLAGAEIQTTAGDQYMILVASQTHSGGGYHLYFFNTDVNTPEQLTPAFFSSATGNGTVGVITAADVAPISGQVFAQLPSSFGAAPQTTVSGSNVADVNGDLGVDSFMLNNGSIVDAYAATAQSSGLATVSIVTSAGQDFDPVVEVLEFSPRGTETNWWVNSNTANGSSDNVTFAARAGYTYEIVVGSKTGATGSYTLAYASNVLAAPQQLSPN